MIKGLFFRDLYKKWHYVESCPIKRHYESGDYLRPFFIHFIFAIQSPKTDCKTTKRINN